MKILSLNTWQECGPWRERWEIIFRGIETMKPDVIGFQEVFNAKFAEEIQKRTGYASKVFPKESEKGGLLILSRFPVLSAECLKMKTKSPSEDYDRYVLFAELKTDQGPLCFFNTHWSWKLDESRVRQAQAEDYLEFVRRAAGDKAVAATGD